MALHLSLEQVAGPLTAKQADLLYTAREECERLQALVDEVLDLARIQGGRIELHRAPCAPATLIDAAIQAHRSLAEEHGLVLQSEVLPGLPDVLADRQRIQLVLSNLVANAIRLYARRWPRHRRCGSPRATKVKWFASRSPIPAPEFLASIRRAFSRSSCASPGASGGVGLGLAIARDVVAAHGGRDRLEGHRRRRLHVLVHGAERTTGSARPDIAHFLGGTGRKLRRGCLALGTCTRRLGRLPHAGGRSAYADAGAPARLPSGLLPPCPATARAEMRAAAGGAARWWLLCGGAAKLLQPSCHSRTPPWCFSPASWSPPYLRAGAVDPRRRSQRSRLRFLLRRSPVHLQRDAAGGPPLALRLPRRRGADQQPDGAHPRPGRGGAAARAAHRRALCLRPAARRRRWNRRSAARRRPRTSPSSFRHRWSLLLPDGGHCPERAAYPPEASLTEPSAPPRPGCGSTTRPRDAIPTTLAGSSWFFTPLARGAAPSACWRCAARPRAPCYRRSNASCSRSMAGQAAIAIERTRVDASWRRRRRPKR